MSDENDKTVSLPVSYYKTAASRKVRYSGQGSARYTLSERPGIMTWSVRRANLKNWLWVFCVLKGYPEAGKPEEHTDQ